MLWRSAPFIAGRYSGTWDAADVGITDEGFELQMTPAKELIEESDAYGGSAIDAVARGGNAFLQFVSKEYKAGSVAPFWPYGALGVLATSAAPVGRLDSAIAKAMVLSSVANTPAAAAPASLTAPLSILADGANGALVYNSKLRKVPVRLRLYPSASGGNVTWFTLT